MKKSTAVYLIAGFLAGAVYVVACGSGTKSMAAAIGNAIDVVFNNSTSGLTSTNVQAAIDELSSKINGGAIPKVIDADGNEIGMLLGGDEDPGQLHVYNAKANGMLVITSDGTINGVALFYTTNDCSGQAYLAKAHFIGIASDGHLYMGDSLKMSSITHYSTKFATGTCDTSNSATGTLYEAVDVTSDFPATIRGPIILSQS